MGEVIAHLAMSLDGFIADPDDGCDELFGFYSSGDVAVKLSAGFPEPDWPRGGVPVFFEGSVEAVVAKARERAGGQDISIAGATVTHLRYQVQREG